MSSDSSRIIKQAQLADLRFQIGAPGVPQPDPDVETLREQAERLQAETEARCRDLLVQAEKQAEAVMGEARAEAVRLLSEAQQRVHQIESQAHADGVSRGEAEGLNRLTQTLDQFQQVMMAAHADRARLLAGAESEVVRLVLQIVRKILKIEPIINEQVLVRVTRDALERLGQRVDVNIYVHPEDIELLHFSLSQIQNLALEIVIEPDDRIEPGGCRIESRAGEIDARLSSQFEAVAQSFLAIAEGDQGQAAGA